jgi:hypothetical protein
VADRSPLVQIAITGDINPAPDGGFCSFDNSGDLRFARLLINRSGLRRQVVARAKEQGRLARRVSRLQT